MVFYVAIYLSGSSKSGGDVIKRIIIKVTCGYIRRWRAELPFTEEQVSQSVSWFLMCDSFCFHSSKMIWSDDRSVKQMRKWIKWK